MKQDMTIKDIAALLQKKIDIRLQDFMELNDRLKAISLEIEQLELKMYPIIMELEPVQSLVYAQNPKLERIFESLKKVYGNDNGIDREADE